MLEGHATVVLTRDLPKHGLVAGDVGAVVHCCRDGATYEVEFVTGDGRTVAVLTIPRTDLRAMRDQKILDVRGVAA
ncbi:hypothetical protein CKO31_14710 [Thiohalocapsa halophila]|uniref:DUF4926 domain-containing protein n=1 Tax=Thiohalocapsa halophila TaxID=69359 RepID=A0ABS1CJU6_9GAMM|nr:DUF4926 domain-containing protein [Thiohalocapsa halophila]MBK1631963.1 hypothetical protein [Thiohalocapsa halophila]